MNLDFFLNHLDYVVAIVGGVGSGVYIYTSRTRVIKRNDLTRLVVKLNRNKDRVTKQSKSSL